MRTAWGEAFGLPPEKATVGRLAAALRRMGFDYVFDTTFSADLTIMEEGSEFLERLQKGDLQKFPMFTSCCPGWVRFLKSQYPELTHWLSTSKSPQQMFGAVSKTWFTEKMGLDPKKTVLHLDHAVSGQEGRMRTCRPWQDEAYGQDVDLVLTVREITRMLRADQLDPANMPDEPA